MKKALTIGIMLLILLSFASCGNKDGAPSGMKLASDRTKVDYSFYIPEEWNIDEMSTFSRAHATTDTTSVGVFTFSISEDVSISDWWTSYYRPSLEATSDAFALIEGPIEEVIDGKGAFSYVFTFNSSYANGEEATVIANKSKIVIVKNNENMYVIRYNSVIIGEKDYYSENLESFEEILEAFKFSALEAPEQGKELEDKNTPEGMKLASDKKVVLYSLYVPKSWIIDESGAMTLAHVSDTNKSSISVMQWNQTEDTKTIDLWWENVHKAELSLSFDSFTVIEEGTPITIDEKEAKAYTYTVTTISGNVYKYFVVAVIDQGSIHAITYTSTEALYDETLTVVKEQILPNFKFN